MPCPVTGSTRKSCRASRYSSRPALEKAGGGLLGMLGQLKLISTNSGMDNIRCCVSIMPMHLVSSSMEPVMETITGLRFSNCSELRFSRINSMLLSVSNNEMGLYPSVFRLATPAIV